MVFSANCSKMYSGCGPELKKQACNSLHYLWQFCHQVLTPGVKSSKEIIFYGLTKVDHFLLCLVPVPVFCLFLFFFFWRGAGFSFCPSLCSYFLLPASIHNNECRVIALQPCRYFVFAFCSSSIQLQKKISSWQMAKTFLKEWFVWMCRSLLSI